MQQIGRNLGTDQQQTGQATSAALTTLLGALSRNASDSNGASALNSALERDHDGSLLDNLGGFLQSADTTDGGNILKHVLGGKQQKVERSLGTATGLGQDKMGDLMKMLAPVVLGALGQQKRQQGLDAGGLAQQLGRDRQQLEQQSPVGGVLAGLLDGDGDGDVDAQDLIKQGGSLLGKLFGGR